MKKNIALLTTSRADYGILRPLIKKLNKSTWCNLSIIVSGTHLSKNHGYTVNEIKKDGYLVEHQVDITQVGDSPNAICKSLALGVIGISECFSKSNYDLLILLGDRYEILSAASSALIHNIPIAHIHGGETTLGAIDDSIRHSVTKMADIHFASNKLHANRIIQMGEDKRLVFNVGSLGVENIYKHKFLSRKELEKKITTKLLKKNFMITYHPVTKARKENLKPLIYALNFLLTIPSSKIFISFPNADTFGNSIIDFLKEKFKKYPQKIHLIDSFGQDLYFSLLKHVDCVVGNSSSGIIEAPYIRIPTVNIGNRQKGRDAPKSVFHANETKKSIEDMINQALVASNKIIKDVYGETSLKPKNP